MSVPRIINVTGIDGCGKTTVVEWLARRLCREGCDVEVKWLRFNHFYSKPLLAACRFFGLTRYETIRSIRVGYHDFHRSALVSRLFVRLQYLDAVRVRRKYIDPVLRGRNRVLILDRYVYDILIDLMIDTGIDDLDRTAIGRALLRLLPDEAVVLPIRRDKKVLLEARPESTVDANFKKRLHYYNELPDRYGLRPIDNNGSLDEFLAEVAKRVGISP